MTHLGLACITISVMRMPHRTLFHLIQEATFIGKEKIQGLEIMNQKMIVFESQVHHIPLVHDEVILGQMVLDQATMMLGRKLQCLAIIHLVSEIIIEIQTKAQVPELITSVQHLFVVQGHPIHLEVERKELQWEAVQDLEHMNQIVKEACVRQLLAGPLEENIKIKLVIVLDLGIMKLQERNRKVFINQLLHEWTIDNLMYLDLVPTNPNQTLLKQVQPIVCAIAAPRIELKHHQVLEIMSLPADLRIMLLRFLLDQS